MTVALTLKVHEGLVLAADSASTLIAQTPDGSTAVINVYDNANKIVNLYKGLPLGVITWGSGAIGPQSMTSIFKDLRRMFSGEYTGPDGADWEIDPDDYTVEQVADRVREYVSDELYPDAFQGWAEKPSLGMIVAGYSAESDHAEEWKIDTSSAGTEGPTLLRPGAECGVTVGGQPETVSRLLFGFSPRLAEVLAGPLGVPVAQVPAACK